MVFYLFFYFILLIDVPAMRRTPSEVVFPVYFKIKICAIEIRFRRVVAVHAFYIDVKYLNELLTICAKKA